MRERKNNSKAITKKPINFAELENRINELKFAIKSFGNDKNYSIEINNMKTELNYLLNLKEKSEKEIENAKIDAMNYDGWSM